MSKSRMLKSEDALVSILPTGVESKNDMGALNTESIRPVKNALDALSPRVAANRLLR